MAKNSNVAALKYKSEVLPFDPICSVLLFRGMSSAGTEIKMS
jgi:hypothetical protein